MIQTPPPQTPRPRNAYELRQYLKQLSRDRGAVYREYKQHTDLLMMLEIEAYDELERIEGRQLEKFPWQPQQQQPQVRVAPASMPRQPEIKHLHAGSGRMRFVEASEEPTLPDPSPWGKER